ncbi:MAG: sigma factor-like helix-turn-helix DNA-binding protein, partial [Nitriliruptorales bacterium]
GQRGRPQRPRRQPRPTEDERVRELRGPLQRVLKRLPEIERQVIEYRMGLVDGHPRNITETARQLRLTATEAKQIEQRAFERIREVVPLGQLHKLLQQ